MSIEPMQMVRRHRAALKIGVLSGLVLLCTVVGYLYASTPERPNVASASAREIVTYVSNDRGLSNLPQVEQEQFLRQWQSRITTDSQSRDELKECLKSLSDDDRKKFVTSMSRQFKRAFLDDAKRYAALETAEKFKFITERLEYYTEQGKALQDVARAGNFKKDIPGGPDDVQVWIMENTTAEERAIGEPFAEALKRVREQIRKQSSVVKSP